MQYAALLNFFLILYYIETCNLLKKSDKQMRAKITVIFI